MSGSTLTWANGTTKMNSPKRGEIWWANLEPTRGQEINKKRPVVVLSSDDLGDVVAAVALVIDVDFEGMWGQS